MDVSQKTLACLLVIFVAACSSEKNSNSGNDPFIKADDRECEGRAVSGEYLVVWKDGHMTVEKATSEDSFKEDFLEKHKQEVLIAEPHYRIMLEKSPELLQQRDWGGGPNWGIEAINANDVWNKSAPKQEVIVAVIDSGLDLEHPEIQGAIATNPNESFNGLDDDGNGLIDDVHGYDFVAGSGEVADYTGHGTHVSGVIAAQHGVGKVLGVSPDVKVLPLAFISRDGGGLVSGAINAIRYAAARGAKVINASWGGNACSLSLKQEIENLALKDILFVAAAGNSGSDISTFPEFPAAFALSNMITVGASTVDEKTAQFSNYGDLVDLVAPGANIVSLYPPEYDDDGLLDGVVGLNGTSMAAPFVAGAAAYLWSIHPDASFVDIKAALISGVLPGPYPVRTRGQLDISRALDKLNP